MIFISLTLQSLHKFFVGSIIEEVFTRRKVLYYDIIQYICNTVCICILDCECILNENKKTFATFSNTQAE